MAIINFGSKNYSYPDEGEKNWGGKLRKVIMGLVSYVSSSLKNVVFLDADQTISGYKIFENAPKVSVGVDGNNKREVRLIHEEEFLKQIENSDLKLRLNELEKEFATMKKDRLKNIEDVLGVSDKNSMKEKIVAKLKMTNSEDSTKGSSLNLLFPNSANIDQSSEGVDVTNTLTKLAKVCDAMVPIGTIMPFHVLPNSQMAQWVEFDQSLHNDAQKIELDDGIYKILSGGLWARCDGNFVLPPNYFGKDDGGKCLIIPNLSDAFLSGDTGDGNLGSIVGQNEKMIDLTEMPYHKHGIDHYHKFHVFWTGIYTGNLTTGKSYNTFINYLAIDKEARQGRNKSPWDYGTADLYFNKENTFLIDTTDAYSSDILGWGELQKSFSIRPKSLKVNFFMRVW